MMLLASTHDFWPLLHQTDSDVMNSDPSACSSLQVDQQLHTTILLVWQHTMARQHRTRALLSICPQSCCSYEYSCFLIAHLSVLTHTSYVYSGLLASSTVITVLFTFSCSENAC